MLTGISTYDSDFGKINRMEYEKRSLPGVEFTVYDMDGNALDTITTDEEGKIDCRILFIDIKDRYRLIF